MTLALVLARPCSKWTVGTNPSFCQPCVVDQSWLNLEDISLSDTVRGGNQKENTAEIPQRKNSQKFNLCLKCIHWIVWNVSIGYYPRRPDNKERNQNECIMEAREGAAATATFSLPATAASFLPPTILTPRIRYSSSYSCCSVTVNRLTHYPLLLRSWIAANTLSKGWIVC